MDRLRILLLGTPAVYSGDTLVHIRRRIQRALLLYLAAQEDLVSRARLMELFWPDESEEQARRHLREALSKLRSDLPDPDVILTISGRVGLDRERVSVDAADFQKILHQVERTPWQIQASDPLPEDMYQALLQAVRLWRSPHFLAGVDLPPSTELDDWLSRTGQNLQNARIRILERLADHARTTGDLEGALNWLRSALEEDEFNESLHLKVLEALVRLGRRSEALQHYDYLEEFLQRELNAAPSTAIQSLHQKILQDTSLPQQNRRNGWPVSLSMQVPFVGRKKTLLELKQAFDRGGLVVIFGEAGAGKSRLVQELYYSQDTLPRLLLAPSRSQENELPFQPLIELFRSSVRPDDWAAIAPVWVSQLSRLLPELLFTRSNASAARPEASEQARALLFEAIRQLLMQLAKEKPVLLCLDDAQWADEATLSALVYLLERSFFASPNLLIITARSEEKNVYLENLVASRRASASFLQVNLEQLDLQDVAELARYMLGQTPPVEFVQRLVQDTGGNPLFVLETLRAVLVLSPGPGVSKVPETLPLAGSIRGLMRSRLRQIHPQANQVLMTASIVGNEFDLELVEKASRMEPEQVVQALEELERAHLVRPSLPSNSTCMTYQFIHDKFREVVLSDMSPARRRLLHHRVAQALEVGLDSGIEQQASVLAGHFEAGGDRLSAFRYWILAGEHARQLFSTQEAYACYRRAERLLQAASGRLAEDQVYRLYAGWGELAAENGDANTLRQGSSILYQIGEQRPNSLLIGTALSGLSSAALIEKRYAEALRYIEGAIEHLDRSGDLLELMQAYVRRGDCWMALNHFEAAIPSYQKAISLVANSPHPAVELAIIDAYNQLAEALVCTGWPERGRVHAEEALQRSNRGSLAAGRVWAYLALASTHYEIGQFEQAKAYSHQGIEEAEKIQNWHAAGHLHAAAARSDLLAGYLDGCWKHITAALECSSRAGRDSIRVEALGVKGDLFWYVEEYPAAAEAYRAGLEHLPDSLEAMDVQERLGTMLGFSGQPEAGLALVDQTIAHARAAGADNLGMRAEINRCLLETMRGENSTAVDRVRQIADEAGRRGMATVQIIANGRLARMMLQTGQIHTAIEAAMEMIRHAQQIDSPWLEIWGQRLACAGYQQSGKPCTDREERIAALIARLQAGAMEEPVRQAFLNYRQKVLAEFH